MKDYKMLIYKHTSKTSGKSYIGKTMFTAEERFRGHIKSVTAGSTTHFHKAIRKYGKEDFVTDILVDGITDHKVLTIMEQYYIYKYNTFRKGYNQTIGGEGVIGLKLSDETKAKLSALKSGKNNYFYGKRRPDHAAKMRVRMTGENNPMYGKVVSEETRQRIRDGLKNCNMVHADVTGSKNPRALVIGIYNNDDELMYTCNGNFKGVCADNNLPYNALKKSKKLGGAKIFMNITQITKKRLTTTGAILYVGWSAKTFND